MSRLYGDRLTLKEHIEDLGYDIRRGLRNLSPLRSDRNRRFKQWIIRTFMRDLHDAYLALYESHGDWQTRWFKAEQRAQALELERADLTEIVVSLVAKDEDGHWTTVFDADTRLPDAYQEQLNTLVNQS